MEKQGVIRPGVTPVLADVNSGTALQQKTAAVENLDNDFRKRAADAAQSAAK